MATRKSDLTPWQRRRLDEAESRPAVGNPSLTIREEKLRCEKLRAAFAERYRVKPMKQTERNFYNLFSQGRIGQGAIKVYGHTPSEVKQWRTRIAYWCQSSPLFDHLELWRHFEAPAIMVGHPFDDVRITGERRWILDECRSAGLDVQENGKEASYYGFGSVQFVVFAHGFLENTRRRWELEEQDRERLAGRSGQ